VRVGPIDGTPVARVAFWSAVAFLIACQDGTTREARYVWDGSVQQVGAVEVVHNGPQPLIPAQDTVVRLLWTGPPGALDPMAAVWEEPSHVRAGANAVYVLDPRAGQVVALSWAGRELRRIGRRGGGPGELRGPYGIVVMAPFVGVMDGRSIVRFDTAGGYHDAVRLPLGMPTAASRFRADRYLIGSAGGWHLQTPSGMSRIVPPFPRSSLRPEWSDRDCSRVVAAEGAVLRLSCVQPIVQVLDSAGHLRREFGFQRAAEPASDAELDSLERFVGGRANRAGIRPEFAAGIAAVRREQYGLKPRFRALRASGKLVVVWEQEPREFGDGPATLHLFNWQGIYLAAISFDDRWVDFDLLDSRLVALIRNPETGLIAMSAYRITLPAGALAIADSVAP
jgi:hypothetical protein